jgi:hypothetical protein
MNRSISCHQRRHDARTAASAPLQSMADQDSCPLLTAHCALHCTLHCTLHTAHGRQGCADEDEPGPSDSGPILVGHGQREQRDMATKGTGTRTPAEGFVRRRRHRATLAGTPSAHRQLADGTIAATAATAATATTVTTATTAVLAGAAQRATAFVV